MSTGCDYDFLQMKRTVLLTTALMATFPFISITAYSDTEKVTTANNIINHLLRIQDGEKFLSYIPTGGFGNQIKSFRNALRLAGLLNRTLIVPPLMGHKEFEIGACHDGRILSSDAATFNFWFSREHRFTDESYLSMADIVDVSSINTSYVRTIDMRLFAALYCGLDMSATLSHCAWCTPLIQNLNKIRDAMFPGNMTKRERYLYCGIQMGYLQERILPKIRPRFAVHREQKDCRSTIFMYQRDKNGSLISGPRNSSRMWRSCTGKKMSQRDWYNVVYAAKLRRDMRLQSLQYVNVVDYFGGERSGAKNATVLSVGNTFGLFDLQMPTGDSHGDALSCATQYLGFNPAITEAAGKFVKKNFPEAFACVHFRGGDGNFVQGRNATLMQIKKWVDKRLIEGESSLGSHSLKIFLMTDLDSSEWTEKIKNAINGASLEFGGEIKSFEEQVQRKIYGLGHGLLSNRINQVDSEILRAVFWDTKVVTKAHSGNDARRNMIVYIQQAVCSCSRRGFLGNSISTLAINIRQQIDGNMCKIK